MSPAVRADANNQPKSHRLNGTQPDGAPVNTRRFASRHTVVQERGRWFTEAVNGRG